jgi:uncharacterized protein (DUF1330 family)
MIMYSESRLELPRRSSRSRHLRTRRDLPGAALSTAGGKTFEGAGAPKRVAITELDSLDQAQAWYNSAARKDLMRQRDKAEKVTRSYAVETVN